MRYGLVTDIHSHATLLASALSLLKRYGVDQVVTIGDTYDAFLPREDTEEVCRRLIECGAVGVWGNHDFGLSCNVPDSIRRSYPAWMLDATARLQPRLLLGDCHFSHKEASIDPCDLAQLWCDGEPSFDLLSRARIALGCNSARWNFAGHYHRWWAGTPDGQIDWNGDRVLRLDPEQRWFVIVAAVCDGCCAIFDSDRAELIPLNVRR